MQASVSVQTLTLAPAEENADRCPAPSRPAQPSRVSTYGTREATQRPAPWRRKREKESRPAPKRSSATRVPHILAKERLMTSLSSSGRVARQHTARLPLSHTYSPGATGQVCKHPGLASARDNLSLGWHVSVRTLGARQTGCCLIVAAGR